MRHHGAIGKTLVALLLSTWLIAPSAGRAGEIKLSPNIALPGTDVTVTGESFPPATLIRILFDNRLEMCRASSDSRGHYSCSFTMPVAAPGNHSIIAVDQAGHAQASRNVRVAFEVKVASTDATSVRLQWTPLAGAIEYLVFRNGAYAGSSIAAVGYFTDFELRPNQPYQYVVKAHVATTGVLIAQSLVVPARTARSIRIRRQFTVLAIAFDPEGADPITEATYLKHRIQFLKLASLGDAIIHLYKGAIVSLPLMPPLRAGTRELDYVSLVTRRDWPGLEGHSILDLVEKGDIDHVWVVKAPDDVAIAENMLMGSRPIQGNDGLVTSITWQPLYVACSRSFFVNSYLPDERSYDAYAHWGEGVMSSVTDGHPENWPRAFPYLVYADHNDRYNDALVQRNLNVWERFRLADGWNGRSEVAYASSGNSNAGSSHFPPTTPRTGGYDDYTYFDFGGPAWHRYVDSAADDWQNYPEFSDARRRINGYEFGAFNNYAEGEPSYSAAFGASPEAHKSYSAAAASFHQWWFAHMPHNSGVSDGRLSTWWPYLYDFNRFNGSKIDYPVYGFREIEHDFPSVAGEYGTEQQRAAGWGYWHSQNGFSPGGKSGELSIVRRADDPLHVKRGEYALKVRVENAQYWEWLGVGRNDVFYPVSRNAHWQRPNLAEVRFSIKPERNAGLLAGTNPIVRLYKNQGTRVELVPLSKGAYTNRLRDLSLRDSAGWYNFRAVLSGDPRWEKNVIGYIDPRLSGPALQAARARLEHDILSDLSYVEISLRSTGTATTDPPFHALTYYIDDLELLDKVP